MTEPNSPTEPSRAANQAAWLEHLYSELHAIAERCFRSERSSHTLQPTALVHEAMLRLSHYPRPSASGGGEENLLAIAAVVMRRVLVDHARRRRERGRASHEPLTLVPLIADDRSDSRTHIDVLVFDEMLERFSRIDQRASRVIELRFFGGLSVEETAGLLGLSPSTVQTDSRFALAWMRRDLSPDDRGRRG